MREWTRRREMHGEEEVTPRQSTGFGCSVLCLWLALVVLLPLAGPIGRWSGWGLDADDVRFIICTLAGGYLAWVIWSVFIRTPRERLKRAIKAEMAGPGPCSMCGKSPEGQAGWIACPSCGAPYHFHCWRAARVCTLCGRARGLVTHTPGSAALLAPTEGQARGICPYCQHRVGPDEEWGLCPTCRTPHHVSCWRHNGGCATYGCLLQPQRR